MKPEKVPEVVRLAEVVGPKEKVHNGNKPLDISKTERAERRKLGVGNVKFYGPDQRPEYKKSVHRKRSCPICGYTRGNKLMAICPRCNNCMACGSYNGQTRDRICNTCGNYDSGKRENVPTIIVN